MKLFKKILLVIFAIIVIFAVVQVVNAAKYKMVVNVVDGEDIIGVNPLADKLDFGDLSRNAGMTRYVTMKSGGGISTYVFVLKMGGISDLVRVDKNYFVLEPGQEVKIAFEIKIPPSAETKQYSGRAIVFRLPKLF